MNEIITEVDSSMDKNVSFNANDSKFSNAMGTIHGDNSFKSQHMRLSNGSILVVTIKYFPDEYSDESKSLIMRCLINTSGDVSVYELKSSFESIIKAHISSIFSLYVRFTHIQFKITGSNIKTALIRLNGIHGAMDEPGSKEALSMEVKLGSGKLQTLKLFGVPNNILLWDLEYSNYTKSILKFSSFFQLVEFSIKDVKLSVQGFHNLPLFD